jgi:hypothetical protein
VDVEGDFAWHAQPLRDGLGVGGRQVVAAAAVARVDVSESFAQLVRDGLDESRR